MSSTVASIRETFVQTKHNVVKLYVCINILTALKLNEMVFLRK